MASALSPGSDASVLKHRPMLHTGWHGYNYSIIAKPGAFYYQVSRSNDVLSAKILFAIGVGSAGQTYILVSQGKWYESRVSYYSGSRGLDLTLGQNTDRPTTLTQALGKELPPEDRASCLGCHSSGENGKGVYTAISCETCHGSGSAHVESIKRGQRFIPMQDLKRLTTE